MNQSIYLTRSYRASPRLKDAIIPNDALSSLYTELVLVVRRLFHCCKLVHADLSEYNILYHQNHLYIIDVSQSVEHDHPAAFDFLRNDIKNIEEFFGRLGVRCLGLKRCFEFITHERLVPDLASRPELGVQEEKEEEILTRWIEQGSDGKVTTRETNQAHEDSVFMRSFIPRTLREVVDPERDVERVKKGQRSNLIYADTIGIVEPLSTLVLDDEADKHHQGVRSVETTAMVSGSTALVASPRMGSDFSDLEEDSSDPIVTTGTEGEGSGGKGEEEEGSEIGGWVEKRPKGHRHEDREAKKVRVVVSFFFNYGYCHLGEASARGLFIWVHPPLSLDLTELFYRRGKGLSRQKPRNAARTKCPRPKRSDLSSAREFRDFFFIFCRIFLG